MGNIPHFMFCAYCEDLGPKLQTAGFERKPAARFRVPGSIEKGLPLEKGCPSDLPYAVSGGGGGGAGGGMAHWTPLPEVLNKGLRNGAANSCNLAP